MRAAAQQAPPFPRHAAAITAAATNNSWPLFTISSRVFSPENVKNIGSKNTTANGSSWRWSSRAKKPRGIAMPNRNPPKTAWIPILSVIHTAIMKNMSVSASSELVRWPDRSVAVLNHFNNFLPTVSTSTA